MSFDYENSTCDELFKSKADKQIIQRAIKWYPDENLEYLNIDDCDEYLKSWKTASDFIPRRKEETQFPLAFSILTYKDFNQVEQLLRTIYRPWNYYCIHVDLKSNKRFYHLINYMVNCLDRRYNNIVNTEHRFDVEWGRMSLLEAELNCMRELYQRYESWKYYINLTGQEFPLKTNWELVRIFRAFKGANNVVGYVKGRHENHFPKKNLSFPFVWHEGSVHITVNRDFVKFALTDKRSKEMIESLKNLIIPDEKIFPTLNFNTDQFKIPGSYVGDADLIESKAMPGINFISRFKSWSGYSCLSGKFVRTICIWGVLDLPKLVEAPHLFANKFHQDFQPATLKCLEYHYLKKLEREVRTNQLSINETFYETRPFVLNRYIP